MLGCIKGYKKLQIWVDPSWEVQLGVDSNKIIESEIKDIGHKKLQKRIFFLG
jgi:hypothetical protein